MPKELNYPSTKNIQLDGSVDIYASKCQSNQECGNFYRMEALVKYIEDQSIEIHTLYEFLSDIYKQFKIPIESDAFSLNSATEEEPVNFLDMCYVRINGNTFRIRALQKIVAEIKQGM